MVIKNEKLNELIKEKGSKRVITLYINRKINLTRKQLNLVLENEKKEKENEKKTKIKTISLRLTEWEYQELQNVLKITKQSQSTFITIAILEKIQRIGGKSWKAK